MSDHEFAGKLGLSCMAFLLIMMKNRVFFTREYVELARVLLNVFRLLPPELFTTYVGRI